MRATITARRIGFQYGMFRVGCGVQWNGDTSDHKGSSALEAGSTFAAIVEHRSRGILALLRLACLK
jgi:hypothetical protein